MGSEQKISELLRSLADKYQHSDIRLGEISSALHEKGFWLLLFVFAFPMALPLPYPPGFSSLISLPLLFFSLQMAIGRKDIYLPQALGNKVLIAGSFSKVIYKVVPSLQKVERYVQPRGEDFFKPHIDQKIGIFVFILAFCIALPLSFLSNTIPAAGISIIALAMMERDRKALMVGGIVGLVGLAITLLVVALIVLGIQSILS